MSLNKILAKEAKKKGICQEWLDQLLLTDSIDSLLEMYLKGIDFCLSNDYPSNEVIRQNFIGKMEQHGIFLDTRFSLTNIRKVVALGESSGSVEIGACNTSEIFVKHSSQVSITARENAFVVVDVFDQAKVVIHAQDSSRILVNKYMGASVEITQDEKAHVKMIEKHKKTY